jgi:hypothetical protein
VGEAPRTVVEEFTKIKSGDVVLPARPASFAVFVSQMRSLISTTLGFGRN